MEPAGAWSRALPEPAQAWVISGHGHHTAAPPTGYVQPEIDVPALTALLDGKYAEVRDLVRTNLAEYASILEEAETS